jgi:DNA-binding NarL/FixJ family response regulator
MTAYAPIAPDPVTLWLVEDDPVFRETLCRLFSTSREVDCQQSFSTFEQVLDALDTEFAPEILLSDLQLPGMSGLDGIERFSQISPSTRIIVLSVHHDDDRIFEAICRGASGYLKKPSRAEEIIRAIVSARDGGAPISPGIASRILTMFRQDHQPPEEDYGLSSREREILGKLVDGQTKGAIAESLHLSFHTVDMHVRNIYAKLQVHSRSGAVAKALKERLV